jgi:hypothetical protein
MNQPSIATVKRLFAVSHNRCAFPKCGNPIVDPESGKVTGRICHIKAQSSGGPRYDPSQTDDERHSFENLLLLCPIHHDVIDSDPTSYTVDRLRQIKAAHESGPREPEPADEIARQMVAISNVVTGGSVITSVGQSGGQVAHSITNVQLAPAADHYIQPVISRKDDSPTCSILRIRLRNGGTRKPSDLRFRAMISERYLRHQSQPGQTKGPPGTAVFEKTNDFFVDQRLFDQLYPGETTTQTVQEIIYFVDDPLVDERDFVEIRVRSGDSPELRVSISLTQIQKLQREQWYRVEGTGELYEQTDD